MKQKITPTIILLGDQCIDEYRYGIVDRISPEAPVPVFTPTRTITKPGMAANVRENLIALGAKVTDYMGKSGVKTRLIDERHHHQIVRIDYDAKTWEADMETMKLPYAPDAIVISDYDKGFITEKIVYQIKDTYDCCPILVDTKKKDLSIFEGCYVKINEHEYSALTRKVDDIIVTHGGSHVAYRDKEYRVNPPHRVFDVTGAGDTFLAALTMGFLETKNMDSAIHYAIAAASITVQHVGVYAPSPQEIYNEIHSHH